MKTRHIARVSRKECTLENGFVFNDILTDYERIADHCSNIAVDILECGEDMNKHEYHLAAEAKRDESFTRMMDEYAAKYPI